MEFDTVRLLGNSERSITLPLYPSPAFLTEPYICKSIVGLDPPPIDVHLSESPGFPGFLLSRHTQSREVVLRIGLNPYFARVEGGPQTLKAVREEMYRTVLSPNASGLVTLQLLNASAPTTPVALIQGHSRQFEAPAFTKDPETQISLICPNPYFTSPNTTDLVNSGSATAIVFENEGEAPVGFFLALTLSSTHSSFVLSDNNAGKSMQITHSLPAGSTLTIDTRPGSRGVSLTTGGTVTNLMGALNSFSDWLLLEPGANAFTASSGGYSIAQGYYTQAWWGV